MRNRSGRRNKFLRSVRIPCVRNFTLGPWPLVKSGPDVFADALAPIAEAASGVLGSRHPATIPRHRDFMRAAPSRRFSAMVIVLRNRKLNRIWRMRGKRD